MEDFYRDARRRLDVLMDGDEPAGGRWNFDARQPRAAAARARTRSGVPEPLLAERGRHRRRGPRATSTAGSATATSASSARDGPRLFPATRREALARARHFVDHRLPAFGPHEDAMLAGDPWMAHSLLSAPLNLGLLDPLEVVERGRAAPTAPVTRRSPRSRASSARSSAGATTSGTSTGTSAPDYRRRNALRRRAALRRDWFAELDADAVEAALPVARAGRGRATTAGCTTSRG